MPMKNLMTPAGIEPATFRFVAQQINHCAIAVPASKGQMGFNLAFKGLISLINSCTTLARLPSFVLI